MQTRFLVPSNHFVISRLPSYRIIGSSIFPLAVPQANVVIWHLSSPAFQNIIIFIIANYNHSVTLYLSYATTRFFAFFANTLPSLHPSWKSDSSRLRILLGSSKNRPLSESCHKIELYFWAFSMLNFRSCAMLFDVLLRTDTSECLVKKRESQLESIVHLISETLEDDDSCGLIRITSA